VAPPCEWFRKIGIIWPLFAFFCKFGHTEKAFPENLGARIILVLDAAFVPNLTFLGLLNSEILSGEKQSPHTQLISPSVNISALQ